MLVVILYIALGVHAALTAVTARQLFLGYKKFHAPVRRSGIGNEVDLPSVTVCIPARNEQHALADCLQKVIASSYEKLEIIVLDDSSGDDTSTLIKAFAHEGVRFVQGKALPSGWLGKNHALQGLLDEASGSYVFFMDVDTRLSPEAIENTVRYALSQGAGMVSVLPRREDGWRFSVVASPLRYFWELVFHRQGSPATSSNAWLVRRSLLRHKFQGFESIKNAIQPETVIAAELQKTNEYRFLISSEAFGVGYEKKWRSQLLTSVRLLFPLLKRDWALASVAVLDLLLLLLPFVVLLTAAFLPHVHVVHILAAVLALASLSLYGSYAYHVWRKGWWIGMLLWPFLLIQEVLLIVVSAIQYSRRAVTWKGRTIRLEVRN